MNYFTFTAVLIVSFSANIAIGQYVRDLFFKAGTIVSFFNPPCSYDCAGEDPQSATIDVPYPFGVDCPDFLDLDLKIADAAYVDDICSKTGYQVCSYCSDRMKQIVSLRRICKYRTPQDYDTFEQCAREWEDSECYSCNDVQIKHEL